MKRWTTTWIVPVLLASVVSAWLPSRSWAQPVDIQLRSPHVTIAGTTIRIADIADLRGGSATVRRAIADLDLDEFTATEFAIDITSERVRYRILLAGIDDRQFSVRPGDRLVARHVAPLNASRAVELGICRQLSEVFAISEDSIDVQLLVPLDAAVQGCGLDVATLRVAAQLPAELPIGQRNIELTLSDASGHTHTLNAAVRFAVYRDLVMVKGNVSRGELLDESKIERVRRPIDNPQVRFASYDQVVGSVAQSDLQQFSLVKSHAIKSADTAVEQVEIRRNMLMNIIVRQGGLSVTLKNARARQNGRVGDTIEFINPTTQRIIRAKIIDSMTALIEM